LLKKQMSSVMLGTAVLLLTVAGCSSNAVDDDHHDDTVSGVVTEVSGSLTEVESFVILDDEGNSHLFRPEPGLLFLGGPLGHLREHVVSGERVTVTFEPTADGEMIATLIVHEDESEPHDHG
jgi:hypothetical protein